GAAGQSGGGRPHRTPDRSVLADRARVPPGRHLRELARPRAAADARIALARLLRLAVARARDPAGARSRVRRDARPHHRARRPAEDGPLTWPNSIVLTPQTPPVGRPTIPKSITRRATSTSARSSASAPG